MTTYQVLIATIPHRHERLCELLAHLDRQAVPGFGVLLYRDNLQQPVSRKRQVLLEAARADYVSHVDDDDWVPDDFVRLVMGALEQEPDYVGFRVRYTLDGDVQMPVEHSLRCPGWQSYWDKLIRDISHLNPMRRELALLGRFDYTRENLLVVNGEDFFWADQVRQTRQVRTEVWLDQEMYHYRYRTADNFGLPRVPLLNISPLPSYPWLTVLEAST
jgi:hypothetical protein